MRLHRLQLAAFGAFADQIDVDLDRLGADGLFLLHGDTGAGKTSVLDAIAFALFGRVPGARNDAKRLRCDRADAATATFVRIEATLGGHRVEITRSPAYLRPKAKGVGLTEVKHKVQLRWLDAPPAGARAEGLTRAEEVGMVVVDLLGMSADQFFQVVLLPQGDFARFLRSDTAEREVLLEHLFDTERFGSIEEWFAAARRESGALVRERRVQIGQLTARVAEAGGVPGYPVDDPAEWIADLRDRLADQAAVTAEAARAAGAVRVLAEGELVARRSMAARIGRLRALQHRQSELRQAAAEHDAWRRALVAHAQAQPVVAAAAAAGQLAERANNHRALVDHQRLAAERLVAPDEDVPKTTHDLRAVSAITRDEAGSLAGLIAQEQDQARDETALSTAGRTRQEIAGRLSESAQVLSELPVALARVIARGDRARAAAGRVDALAERAEAARAQLAAADAVVLRRVDHQKCAAEQSAAIDDHQRAVDHRQRLVQRRIDGMAAELAVGLVAEHPCPVCGSADHPRPAAAGDGAVTVRQIADAERLERRAASAREKATARREAASIALAQVEALSNGRSRAEAAADWADADARWRAERESAADLVPAEAAAAKCKVEFDRATEQRQLLIATLAGCDVEFDRLSVAIQNRAERLVIGRGGYPDVASRRDHLLELADALDRLAVASQALESVEVSLGEAATTLVDALADSPFPDLGAARFAAAIDRDGVARRLRAAEDEFTAVDALLSDQDFSGLDLTAEPDVAAAQSAVDHARSAADGTALSASTSAARRDRVAVAAGNLARAWQALEPVLAADAELAALTDVILGKGQNALAMSLRTYVLAAKLAQVALSAGERLSAMSSGRYTFVQSREKESRGRSGGLGLDILDAFSGLVRPAKTLSGGESFLASLALALGLADVVGAQAGGRQLDTMFIDEGFGSLDADTLDMVMNTLDELRAGGRIVGVVSHVDEMRQRIPSRLRITSTPAGSTLELSVG